MRASWDGEQCLFWGVSISSHKKSTFRFLSAKNGIFYEAATNNPFEKWTTPFYKILYHILCIIHQLVACQKLSSHLSPKRQISADSGESGPNLSYSCVIVYS